MKTLLLALCFCLLAFFRSNAQQPGPKPILLVYVQKSDQPAVAPRIALGLVQPTLIVSSFEKSAALTNLKEPSKWDGIAVQLRPDDAKLFLKGLNAALFDAANDANAGTVWFATPDNKVLGCLERNLVQTVIGDNGILLFFANDNAPLIHYLEPVLKSE